MKKKKIRPLGQILLEAELLIDEVIDNHEVQWGDIIYWVLGHMKIHRPDAQETYVEDGSHPELYYGPKS